jgi:ATP:ADP antiporter, AAA family
MLGRIVQFLWGKFEDRAELKKFLMLAGIFFCIIGVYWSLRPIKDSVFVTLVGIDLLPWAKVFSIICMLPLIISYTKLIDIYPRHKVFYLVVSVYGVFGLLFAYFLMHPEYGLSNTHANPVRIIGWLWYAYVESFGSLIVALFWVITTDTSLPEAAKRGFPLIALFGQTGNIVGPMFLQAQRLGFGTSAPVIGICAVLMFVICLLMWIFMRVTPPAQLRGYVAHEILEEPGAFKKEKQAVGFLDGLKLIFSRGYLFGIFLITAAYEVIVTIFDYQLKSMGRAVYGDESSYAAFLAHYSSLTGVVAVGCILFGINSIQRRLGMKISLLLVPCLVVIAVLTLKFHPILSVVFWIVVLSKGVNYALNQPTIKQLYIPTTKEARYKSQGWIDMFGSRAAKSCGSVINMTRAVFKSNLGIAGLDVFLTFSSLISLGIIGGWLFVAVFVAKEYNAAIKEKKYVC